MRFVHVSHLNEGNGKVHIGMVSFFNILVFVNYVTDTFQGANEIFKRIFSSLAVFSTL